MQLHCEKTILQDGGMNGAREVGWQRRRPRVEEEVQSGSCLPLGLHLGSLLYCLLSFSLLFLPLRCDKLAAHCGPLHYLLSLPGSLLTQITHYLNDSFLSSGHSLKSPSQRGHPMKNFTTSISHTSPIPFSLALQAYSIFLGISIFLQHAKYFIYLSFIAPLPFSLDNELQERRHCLFCSWLYIPGTQSTSQQMLTVCAVQ